MAYESKKSHDSGKCPNKKSEDPRKRLTTLLEVSCVQKKKVACSSGLQKVRSHVRRFCWDSVWAEKITRFWPRPSKIRSGVTQLIFLGSLICRKINNGTIFVGTNKKKVRWTKDRSDNFSRGHLQESSFVQQKKTT